MPRHHLATIASAALLSVSVFVWRDLFFFSKVAHLPAWTAILPIPINTPAYLAFACLIPAAFIPSTASGAARALAWAIAFSPLPALIMYIASTVTSGTDLWLNAAFNYAWVVGFHCFLPALGLFAVRALAAAIKGRVGG